MNSLSLQEKLRQAKEEFQALDHAYQMAHASGNYRHIKAASEARAISLRQVSQLVKKLQNN